MAVLGSGRWKRCPKCQASKRAADYFKNKRQSDGLSPYCKPCHSAVVDSYHRCHPERVVHYRLKTQYGIDGSQYEAMHRAQAGLCLACGKPEKVRSKNARLSSLCVHHDHRTGRILGLLCRLCNAASGMLRDDPVIMRRLAAIFEGAAHASA